MYEKRIEVLTEILGKLHDCANLLEELRDYELLVNGRPWPGATLLDQLEGEFGGQFSRTGNGFYLKDVLSDALNEARSLQGAGGVLTDHKVREGQAVAFLSAWQEVRDAPDPNETHPSDWWPY
jgi:hypothetical protein